MGTALVALLFAILHFCRTVMGLWQLHLFKQWAVASVKSMDSLGYSIVDYTGDSDSDDADGEHDGIVVWLHSVFFFRHTFGGSDATSRTSESVCGLTEANAGRFERTSSTSESVCGLTEGAGPC